MSMKKVQFTETVLRDANQSLVQRHAASVLYEH